WNETKNWAPQRQDVDFFFRQSFLPLLTPLVVIAWMFLIVRVVQGESLVGDRQFWVTRPYEWKKLLVAKFLFFVVFINVPLFIAQAALLRKAGYAPSAYVHGLLWMQLLWVVILILPTTTLATITSSLGQVVLVVLGILVFVIGYVSLSSRFNSPNVVLTVSWTDEWLVILAIPSSVCLAVVLWQYARRRALQSRLLLIGYVVAILAFPNIPVKQTDVDRAYPQPVAGQPSPVQLAFDPVTKTTQEFPLKTKNKVWVWIPLLASGIAPNSEVQIRAITAKIVTPDGVNWDSHWLGAGEVLLPGHSHAQVRFPMDRAVFNRVQSSFATVHISFGLSIFKASATNQVSASASDFTAIGETSCWMAPELSGMLECRSPMRNPFLLLTAQADETTCHLGENEKAALSGKIVSTATWNTDAAPAEFGISPVKTFSLFLSDRVTPNDPSNVLCPGTPLTFSTLVWGSRTRAELTIDGIHVGDYQFKDSRSPGIVTGGVGVSVP
ncbi:MAG: hypothetical protein ABSA32_15025, partial [Candidatus Acidiferrales bacterium]